MQKRPIIVALSVAGIIAGTHAGIAAMSNEVAGNVTDPAGIQTEPQAIAEAQAPAESSQALVAQAPVESVVQPGGMQPSIAEPSRAAGAKNNEHYTRVPFTNIRLKVSNPTFPNGGLEQAEPLPSIVAYFDRKNAGVMLTGAARPVFPSGSSDSPELLPSVVAHFDRIESQRLASVRPAPTNTAAMATDSSVTAMSSASEASSTTIKSEIQVNQLPGT